MSAPRTYGLALLAVLAASSCGRAGAPPAAAVAAPRPAPDSVAQLDALFRARRQAERARFTGADVHFMTGMIAHHAQALAMCGLVPGQGASPAVRTLARRIFSSQTDDIALMREWLRERGQPAPAAGAMDHGQAHGAHMPGMLTGEQMRQLGQARGAEFDRLFLTLMIQHHRGALVMARELFGTDGASQDPAVFRFASDVQMDQSSEIELMERMLTTLPAPHRAR